MPKRLVYLDNAATTPVRPEVLEAMLPYLGREAFGNPSSAHRFGRTARAGLEEAKRTIAECLGVEPGQVIFTSGGTEADNLARSEEHTSELQSRLHLVCRLLLEKKKM